MHQRQPDANTKTADPYQVISTWPVPANGNPGLDFSAKYTWQSLVKLAGGPTGRIDVHCATLGAKMGVADPRCVRRYLEALKAVGLITMEARDRYRGERAVELLDPWQARQAWEREMRLVSAANSGQRELFPDQEERPQEPESPSEGSGPPAAALRLPRSGATPPNPAADGRRDETSADQAPDPPSNDRFRRLNRRFALSIEDSNTNQALRIPSAQGATHALCETAVQAPDPPPQPPPVSKAEWDRLARHDQDALARLIALGQSAKPADPSCAEVTAGQAIAEALRTRHSTEGRFREASSIAALIRTRLADPNFFPGFYDRIAWAVIDDHFPEPLLKEILDRLDRVQRLGKLNTSRGAYFLGAIQREFCRLGLKLKPAGGPR